MLPEVDPDTLRRRAAELRAAADDLDRMAAALEARARSRRYEAMAAAAVVARHVAAGHPEAEAVALASAETGLDPARVEMAWKISKKQRAAMQTYAKRQAVRAMTEAGLSDREIARALGCHEKHVPRLRRPPTAAPEAQRPAADRRPAPAAPAWAPAAE